MKNFNFANSSNLEVNLNMNLTLNWMKIPPTFSIKSNKILKDNILSVIEKLKPFSDTKSWSIKYSIYDTIVNIHNMINTYGEIEVETSNNFEIMINELEYLFTIKLENISSTKLLELFDKNLVNSDNSGNSSNPTNSKYVKEYWKKGTGYGHDQANNSWDIDEYVRNLNNKKNQIGKKIEEFIKCINNDNSVLLDNKNQIIQIFTNYLNHDQITSTNITNISDILMNNSKIFDHKETAYVKLLKNIRDYLEENNIDHPIISGNSSIKNIVNIDINNVIKEMEISKLTEYQKLFYDYKFKFIDSEYKSFYYDKNSSGNSDSPVAIVSNETITLEQIARLKKEFNILKKSITIGEEASLFFTVDKSKIYKTRFIVTGPKDTPYSYGIYLFDMSINKNFPQKPPVAQFLNHGNKRFNPNLYDSGKLCLSLLGTWNTSNKGESWNSSVSTFSQVLLSIQSLILIDEPYFNEPGHEKSIGTKQGTECSQRYNFNIRKYNLDHAINDLIENIVLDKNNYKEFEYVIRNHFKFHAENIKKQNLKWYEEMPDNLKASFKTSMDKFENYVAKL
jgi:ubiquitin-protein ligase